MKKILFVIVCSLSIWHPTFADTTSVQVMPVVTTVNDTDKIWIFNGDPHADKTMMSTYFLPIRRNGYSLYPRYAADNFVIGSGDGTVLGSNKLTVYGSGDFTTNLTIGGNIYLGPGQGGTIRIYASGNNLMFKDLAGTHSLSELFSSGGSELEYANGMGLTGSKVSLGALPFERNTEFDLGNYSVNFTDNAGTNLSIGQDEITGNASTDITLSATEYALLRDSKFSLGSTSSTGVTLRDYSSTPLGLTYYADYSANIVASGNKNIGITWKFLENYIDTAVIQGTGTGGGNVYQAGTQTDNQLATWTNDSTVKGETGLTYNGTTLAVTGHETVSGNLTVSGTLTANVAGIGIELADSVPATPYLKVYNAAKTYWKAVQMIADSTGTAITVASEGSDANLSSTDGLITFGTTSPTITIAKTGKWHITGFATIYYNDATWASGSRIVTIKLRKTSGTPADVTGTSTPFYLYNGGVTESTETLGTAIIDIVVTTTVANTTYQIWGVLNSAFTSHGYISCSRANLTYTRASIY